MSANAITATESATLLVGVGQASPPPAGPTEPALVWTHVPADPEHHVLEQRRAPLGPEGFESIQVWAMPKGWAVNAWVYVGGEYTGIKGCSPHDPSDDECLVWAAQARSLLALHQSTAAEVFGGPR